MSRNCCVGRNEAHFLHYCVASTVLLTEIYLKSSLLAEEQFSTLSVLKFNTVILISLSLRTICQSKKISYHCQVSKTKSISVGHTVRLALGETETVSVAK